MQGLSTSFRARREGFAAAALIGALALHPTPSTAACNGYVGITFDDGPTSNTTTLINLLKQNSLTARDYLVGVPALRMALIAAQGATAPNIVASPANVTFAKANLAQLKPKMDAADGIRR